MTEQNILNIITEKTDKLEVTKNTRGYTYTFSLHCDNLLEEKY